MWLYSDGVPAEREIWLFGIVIVWEYFAMIYVRSALAVSSFPRATFLLYILFHVYMYSFPSGFHITALLLLLSFSVWIMMLLLRKYEVSLLVICY